MNSKLYHVACKKSNTERIRWQVEEFDVCLTVHHIWKWPEVPNWCNNCD